LNSVGSARPARTLHQRFVSSAVLIAGLSAITGLAMLGRESITARVFGRSDQIEAFLLAALIPVFLINATGNSIAAGFVPTLLGVRHKEGQRSASDLTAAFLLVVLGLIAAAMAVAAVASPFLLPLIARGFDAPKLELTLHLFHWLLPIVAIGALGKFWLAVLNGYERFIAGSLIPIVVPLSVIVLLVLAPETARLDFLVYGIATGFALQLAAALAIAGRRRLLCWPKLLPQVKPLLAKAASQYFSLLAGTLTLMLLEVVDTTFAALRGAGTVAAINYASKLSVLVLSLVGTAMATAVVPYYARLRASGTLAEQTRFVRFGETLALGGGTILAILLALLSTEIVTIVFNGGRFGAADVAVVSKLNALYVLQAPAFLVGVTYGRLLLVEGQSRALFSGAILSVACAVTANVILAPFLGGAGIPVAGVIAYIASAIWLRVRLTAVLRERRVAEERDA
jgi:putative peptidoglycan lipid II flippase